MNVKEHSTDRGGSILPAIIPAVAAIVGALFVLFGRLYFGPEMFLSDPELMILGLAAYLIAAVFFLTDLFIPFRFAQWLGLTASVLGVLLNLSSWLVRWVGGYENELAIFNSQGIGANEMPWILRYIPFANLYDLSLAFAFGAGITTLLVMRDRRFRAVAILSLPLAALILILARFLGSEFVDLPPVLDSFWRPIHVGVASLSYGVALVCFAAAVLYLLKDGLQIEKMGLWVAGVALSVFATISQFGIFAPNTFGTYAASTFFGSSRSFVALRADIPYVGWLIVASSLILLIALILFAISIWRRNEMARFWGHRLNAAATLVQASAIGILVYQIKNLGNIADRINPIQYENFAVWMLQQQGIPQRQIDSLGEQQLYDIANKWITENGFQLQLSLNANPVEISALITAFAATFFIALIALGGERFKTLLPSVEVLDGLMYKLAGLAFAGLALLLITGAVWANESWGRYWGWDPKEVGALLAWLAYAGFLHSRIGYGWRGRRSAYFAIIAFLFVIFTYLGVSYLLPGLHSYA